MLDDLREQAGGSELDENEFADLEDFDSFEDEFDDFDSGTRSSRRRRRTDLSFGMTPAQRAILSVLLFSSICVLSVLCLLITGRIAF